MATTIKFGTELQILSSHSQSNKEYQMGRIIIYPSEEKFPYPGKEKVIYLSLTTREIYYYDKDTNKYEIVSPAGYTEETIVPLAQIERNEDIVDAIDKARNINSLLGLTDKEAHSLFNTLSNKIM